MEDRALVDAVLGGDPRAQHAFVARFERPIRQTASLSWARGGGRPNDADIDDVVQHIFLSVFARDAQVLRLWKGDASLRGYLKAVTRKLAARHLGRVARDHGRFRLILDAPAAGEADSPSLIELITESTESTPLDAETRLKVREERDSLRGAILAQLSERGRALYQLLFVDELDVNTVAQRESMTPNNVYQWRNRIGGVARKVLTEAGYTLAALACLLGAAHPPSGQKIHARHKIQAVDRHPGSVGPIPGAQTTRGSR